jgi:hypothetical protein
VRSAPVDWLLDWRLTVHQAHVVLLAPVLALVDFRHDLGCSSLAQHRPAENQPACAALIHGHVPPLFSRQF